ncbi:uncharacterized protein LOC132739833 isoform X2 [Ruditapes philippinarum]|uniref:uncharacterized protein LOC132739833 isoform X2 n=1 Tax=Ruditapes philippinarum TaxID=129788 RepID=UPI00295AF9ED|nr:uncharacterized protein LOC132739833 isoform X2 [Ruditapes philippinarum]
MIGAELKAEEGLTPADMVELLCQCRLETLSNEFYPEEDRIVDVYRTFILRLSGEYQCHLIDLGYIPGSFNAVEAGGLLELRKKYCKVFTEVIKKISIQMGTEEYTKAYSEFAVEQPNLQKLLGDVEYTREDTYHFFIEIVSSYTTVIERFMTRESDTFYNACLRLTEMYGRSVDKAVVHLAVGSIETNTKGDFLHGANNYQSALEVLEKMEKSVHLASAYQKMGWNMHRQGLNVEAIQYYKKSLDISVYGGPGYETFAMQSFSSMGISHTYLGNWFKNMIIILIKLNVIFMTFKDI